MTLRRLKVEEKAVSTLKPEQTQALEQAKSQVVAKLADTTGDDGDAAKALLGSSTNAEADGKIAYKFARDVRSGEGLWTLPRRSQPLRN